MDNNNIDNFFRQHSHTMDEIPGDALWQRIEQQLPPVNTGGSSSKTSFSGSKLLLVLMVTATAIVAGIIFMRNSNTEVMQPAVTPVHTVVPETGIEQDTVKKKKPVKNVDTKKQTLPFKPITKQKKADYITPGNAGQSTIKPLTTPEPKTIKTTTVYNPKRTIVTVNEVVNQHIFDSITKASLEKYKDNAGMQLIVKEPRSGYIFRMKFENTFKPGRLTFKQKKDSLAANGMKIIIPQKTQITTTPVNVNFDSLKKVNNTLSPEVITFKKDTIGDAIITPYYTNVSNNDKIYNYNELTTKPEYPGGISALVILIQRNFRMPKVDKDMTVRITVSFIIEKDGSISDIRIVKDPGYGFGEEAVRVLKKLDLKWKPAGIKNEAVRSRMVLPLTYTVDQ